LLLGVGIIIALLIGVSVGYHAQLGQITTSTVTSTYTTTTTFTVTGNPFEAVREVQLACGYLESNFNASVGLVSDTQSHERYFLNSDNYLASLALSRECGNHGLAVRINQTLARYGAQEFPNQYMVFGCRDDLNGSKDYDLSGNVWITINNQSGGPLSSSYADIAFLQAYYEKICAGNAPLAFAIFNVGTAEYNGLGFNDTVFRGGQTQGIYQTYKLALYIYVAELLGQRIPVSTLTTLLQMQAPDGGFYTGYYPGLTHGSTTTNTETTSLAILALG
jgi:hypothetical protein